MKAEKKLIEKLGFNTKELSKKVKQKDNKIERGDVRFKKKQEVEDQCRESLLWL